MLKLKLAVIPDELLVVRFPTLQSYAKHAAGMLENCSNQSFYSVTVTPTETSVVLPASYTNTIDINDTDVKVEDGWCTIRVEGPLDFSLIGILSKLAATLAAVGVSIFVVSTFDTDYILVKSKNLDTAKSALSEAGHDVFDAPFNPPFTATTTTAAAITASTSTTTTTTSTTNDVAGFAPFALERYFAKHEFSAPFLLCCSDVQPLLQKELLAMADEECTQLWDNLSLGYTESQGLPLLRAEIAKHHPGTTPDQIMIVAPEEGIYLSCRAILRKGDTIVVPFPCYQSLSEIARAVGCHILKWYPVENQDGSQSFQVSDVLAMIQEHQPRLVMLNFPHNPTGLSINAEDMSKIVMACKQIEKCWLFGDEMYRGLEHDATQRLPSIVDVDSDFDRTIGLAGMSKLYGLPGLRIGWVICKNVTMMQRISTLRDYTTICSSAPSEILSLIGLRNHQKLTDRSIAIINVGLDAVCKFMREYEDVFVWVPPTAGSISFPKLRNNVNATMFCDEIVRRVGVMLLPSSVYGGSVDNRVRLGFGRTNVPEGLDVLRKEIRSVVEWCRANGNESEK